MNKGQTYILWIVAALMVYNLFINNKIKTDINSYRSKISVLQQKIDSVNILNRELDNKINSLH
jgi:cell division protein FtsL